MFSVPVKSQNKKKTVVSKYVIIITNAQLGFWFIKLFQPVSVRLFIYLIICKEV